MKNIILQLKEDWQVLLFALAGLGFVLFPVKVAGAAPYIVGICSMLYAFVNMIISMKYPDAQTRLGDAVVRGVTGFVVLFLKTDAISVLGVIWAMLSMHDIAGEIDEARKTGQISMVSGVSIIVSLILAAMLMMDPFEHFNMHVRILGLEMIVSAFIRRRKGLSDSP